MLDGDQEFLRQAGEKLEGYFPGMSERIDKLNAEQLGRGIIIQHATSSQLTPPYRHELIGYILPVRRDQREHIILLKSGDIFVTSPATLFPSAGMTQPQADQQYMEKMSPNSTPVELSEHSYPKIERFANDPNAFRIHLWADIRMRNSNPENVPQVMTKVDQAMVVAKETKAERDKAREESATQLMAKIDELLNPKRPAPPGEQPPPLPPSILNP